MQVVREPVVRGGEEPLALIRRAVLVRKHAVDAVVGADVQLVRMQGVIVEQALHRPVVPVLRAVAEDQIEAIHLQGPVRAQPDAVELAGVPVRVAPVGAAVVDAEVTNEDFTSGAALDLADARVRGGAVDGTLPVAAGDVRIAVAHRVPLQVKAVARVESTERALPGLHHIEGGVRRHPEVLHLVGGGADHRLLEDPLRGAVRRVAGAPRTRPAEPGACAAAARRCEQGDGERASQGSTLSTAAPPRVATCSAGGFTIVSSSSPMM